MVGSSSAVNCVVCGGAVLVKSKSNMKFSKLSLRKPLQDKVQLCACSQPSGSSSSSEQVCVAPPKASAKVVILDNVVIKPANISTDEADFVIPASQGKRGGKILRNLLTKSTGKGQKRKSPAKFNLEKYVEQVSNNCGTSKTDEVQINVGDVSKFNSQTIADMSSNAFINLMEGNSQSKIRKLNSQFPGCSQADKNLFEESFEWDDVCDKEAVGSKAARELEALVEELGINVVSGSRRPTSRGSGVRTSPAVASPITAPETTITKSVDTAASGISSAATEEEDIEFSSSLTQQRYNKVKKSISGLAVKLAELQVEEGYVAALEQQLKNIDEQRTILEKIISSKQAQIAGGHSRVVKELVELVKEVAGLYQRKIAVLEEISLRAEKIRQLTNVQ